MAKRQKKGPSGPREYESTDIFASLGVQEPRELGQPDPDEASDASTEALLARIDALQNQLNTVSRTNSALMTPQRVTVSPPPPPSAATEVSYEGLPDPISDQEAYHKELSKRITASVTARIAADNAAREAQATAQQNMSQSADALWEEFTEKHPELAEHRDMVEVAAIEVNSKARRKGVDLQTYMFTASDQYIEDVAAATKRKFGKAIEVLNQEGEEDEGENEGMNAGRPDHSSMEDQMNGRGRTRGITGGLPTGAPRSQTRDEGSDFIADIHAVQRKIGIW